MKNFNDFKLLTIAFLMSEISEDFYMKSCRKEPMSEQELRDKIKKQLENKKIPKGCKEFVIDGIKVYALNEKNAIRKVKNIIKKSLKND